MARKTSQFDISTPIVPEMSSVMDYQRHIARHAATASYAPYDLPYYNNLYAASIDSVLDYSALAELLFSLFIKFDHFYKKKRKRRRRRRRRKSK